MPDKTVAEKLLIKANTKLWLSHPSYQEHLQPWPDGVTLVQSPFDAQVGVVVAEDEATLRDTLSQQGADAMQRPPVVWVTYRKGGRGDLDRDSVWPILTQFGLRPNGQVAVDEVWSALRFVLSSRGSRLSPAGETLGKTAQPDLAHRLAPTCLLLHAGEKPSFHPSITQARD